MFIYVQSGAVPIPSMFFYTYGYTSKIDANGIEKANLIIGLRGKRDTGFHQA